LIIYNNLKTNKMINWSQKLNRIEFLQSELDYLSQQLAELEDDEDLDTIEKFDEAIEELLLESVQEMINDMHHHYDEDYENEEEE